MPLSKRVKEIMKINFTTFNVNNKLKFNNAPVCQTYCTQTYVLAANSSQCTGTKNKHTKSDVIAMHTNNTEKAYIF